MSSSSIEIAKQLRDEDQDEIYSALIKAGKGFHRELRKDVESFLTSSNIELRAGAIKVLGFYWKLPEYKSISWDMFEQDDDDWVRTSALMSWCAYYEKSGDKNVLMTLLGILQDRKEDESVRAQAHIGIFIVSILERSEWPNVILDDVENEVDWQLVENIVKSA